MRTAEFQVNNPSGLHARPAATLVKAAAAFGSRIRIENLTRGSEPVDAKSLLAVLGSGVEKGHRIRIAADGDDEATAIAALQALSESGFGEVPQPSTRTAGGLTLGSPVAGGVAVGPIWHYPPPAPAAALVAAPADAPAASDSGASLRAASAQAARQLESLAERVRELGRSHEAGIFEAQALMASDPELLNAAIAHAEAGERPDVAMEQATAAASALLAAVPDELLAARAADVRDVGARIARILTGTVVALPAVPSIVVADDLPPSIAAEIPPGLLLGVALEGGSATAHVVILARGMGIPAIVGARGLGRTAAAATRIAMDGESGEIVLDPDPSQLADFAARATALAFRRSAAASQRNRHAATADGTRVVLLANIGGPEEAERALEYGAEGIGLFRTEFLFMKRRTAPSEAEQIEPYRRVFEAFGPERPVVIRLADIGGDKALPYLELPPEANPFLGVRGIRLARGSRELLAAQLRAIWRAAGRAGVTPHVMAPMVSTLADARLLIELRDEARAAVARSGDPLPDRMVTGVMVEVPSAAIMAPELARLVDFFSIGTNDLTQYTLAADRSNPALAHLQDALHPAVLRLIAGVVAGAEEAGIPVAVCGELAGDPLGAMVLVGLGVNELSADAGSLDAVRAGLAAVTRVQLADLARQALAAPDAATVRAMARELASSTVQG